MALSEKQHTECVQCGMVCAPNEYHPYAACLMFKACKDGTSVRANLAALRAQDTALIQQMQEALGLARRVVLVGGASTNEEIDAMFTAASAANARLEGKIGEQAMPRDDIIRMAREAGSGLVFSGTPNGHELDFLERFAALADRARLGNT